MNDLTRFQDTLTVALSNAKVSVNSFVAITLDDEQWVIDLRQIQESSVPPKIARIARAPVWVIGAANFKGNIWNVIDMRVLLRDERTFNPKWGWMTLLRPQNDHQVALLWSEIVEIASKEEYDVVPYDPSTAPDRLCKGMWKDKKDQIWKELDVDQIIGSNGLISNWQQRVETENENAGGDKQ